VFLPDEGKFACLTATQRSLIKIRVEKAVAKALAEGPANNPPTMNAELVGINTMREEVLDIVNCDCDKGRNHGLCSDCLESSSISDFFLNKEFGVYKFTKVIDVKTNNNVSPINNVYNFTDGKIEVNGQVFDVTNAVSRILNKYKNDGAPNVIGIITSDKNGCKKPPTAAKGGNRGSINADIDDADILFSNNNLDLKIWVHISETKNEMYVNTVFPAQCVFVEKDPFGFKASAYLPKRIKEHVMYLIVNRADNNYPSALTSYSIKESIYETEYTNKYDNFGLNLIEGKRTLNEIQRDFRVHLADANFGDKMEVIPRPPGKQKKQIYFGSKQVYRDISGKIVPFDGFFGWGGGTTQYDGVKGTLRFEALTRDMSKDEGAAPNSYNIQFNEMTPPSDVLDKVLTFMTPFVPEGVAAHRILEKVIKNGVEEIKIHISTQGIWTAVDWANNIFGKKYLDPNENQLIVKIFCRTETTWSE
jgi:hypothetical protein